MCVRWLLQEVVSALADLKQGIEELRRSKTFKYVLATLLSIGNSLNNVPVSTITSSTSFSQNLTALYHFFISSSYFYYCVLLCCLEQWVASFDGLWPFWQPPLHINILYCMLLMCLQVVNKRSLSLSLESLGLNPLKISRRDICPGERGHVLVSECRGMTLNVLFCADVLRSLNLSPPPTDFTYTNTALSQRADSDWGCFRGCAISSSLGVPF